MAAQVSAVLLIAAFVVVAFSALIGVPGLYAAKTIDDQLRLIEAYKKRWLATQAVVSLYIALTTGGFIALSVDLASSAGVLLPAAGALAIATGAVSGLSFVYVQTTDPRGGYSGQYPVPEVAAYWLWLAGLLLYSVACSWLAHFGSACLPRDWQLPTPRSTFAAAWAFSRRR
jgi:hypothetical protein